MKRYHFFGIPFTIATLDGIPVKLIVFYVVDGWETNKSYWFPWAKIASRYAWWRWRMKNR